MSRFFVSLLTILLASGVSAQEKPKETCLNGKIKVVTFSEEKLSREKFCFQEEVVNVYSASCKKQKCSAFKYPKRFYIHEFLSDKGTPGFKLCREIGGNPEIIEVFVDNFWHRTDRCIFKDGFVDTDTLLDFYIDR